MGRRKKYKHPIEFRPNQPYGDDILISAKGPDDVLAPTVEERARMAIRNHAQAIIPAKYWKQIIYQKFGPEKWEHPETHEIFWNFRLSWRYTPPPADDGKVAALG